MIGYNDFFGVIVFFGFIAMLLIVSAIIWKVVLFVDKKIKRPANHISNKLPWKIINEEYARGEISKKEYNEKKNELLRG